MLPNTCHGQTSHLCYSGILVAMSQSMLDSMLFFVDMYKQWWLNLYHESPQHIFVETGLMLFIIWLMFIRKTVDPTRESKNTKLSEKETQWLLDTWEPEPLVPPLDERSEAICNSAVTVDAIDGNYFKLREYADPVLNMSTYDFLGSCQVKDMKKASSDALHKYGCGSCGPRGFYGTIDVHLTLEAAIAKFMNTEEAIYYSDGASTVSSTIPAFSKRGDLIIMDEACNDAILTGVELSRSTVVTYRHNDMQHLLEILSSIRADDKRKRFDTRQQRRFIVTEGLFRLVGDLCPLPEILKLKEEFFYRLMLDESTSFGVVGKTGHGVTEHFGVKVSDIEIIMVSADTALASVGGLCIGSHEIVDHQRLSGAGYCFSAAAPPFLAAAALVSLKRLEESGESLMGSLQKRSQRALTALRQIKGFRIAADQSSGSGNGEYFSPVIHLCIEPSESRSWEEDEMTINHAVELCLQHGVGVSTVKYSSERMKSMNTAYLRPSIKICLSTALTLKEVDSATATIRKCCESARLTC